MAKHRVSRSAKTGRFVRASTARRHPKTTITQTVSHGGPKGGTRHRSAITGRFVSRATTHRRPDTTITENG